MWLAFLIVFGSFETTQFVKLENAFNTERTFPLP